MNFLYAFLIGGGICALGEILLLKTSMTPARILVLFVVSGVFFTVIGVYDILVEFAGCGATVPLTGFGYLLAQGAKAAVAESGAIGILTGGITASAAGVTAVIVFGFIAALLGRAGTKK